MSKATHGLSPAVTLSKIDTTDWTRETWRAAYGMARRMVRQRPGRSTGEALTWYLDHGFRRFGFNAAARTAGGASSTTSGSEGGRVVLDRLTEPLARPP